MDALIKCARAYLCLYWWGEGRVVDENIDDGFVCVVMKKEWGWWMAVSEFPLMKAFAGSALISLSLFVCVVTLLCLSAVAVSRSSLL